VLYKKRWSDGLHDDFEHLDEFEFKHGCFGGDGGRNGGGDGSNDDSEKPSPAPRDTVASQPKDTFGDMGTSAGFAPGLANVAPGAMADNAPTAGFSPSPAQPAAFGPAPSFSMPSLSDLTISSFPAPTAPAPAPTFSAPTSIEQAIANAQDLGFGSVPGTDTFGYNVPVGPGTLGVGTNLSGDIGEGYGMNFAKGGEVYQGIGSLMRRR
jgi:hypothetical protein